MLAHFATDPKSLKRVRNELTKVLEDKELLDLSHDDCQNLSYLSCVIQESLRYNPPGPATTEFSFSQEAKIANLTIRPDVRLMINIYGLHRNSEQW